MGDNWWKRAKCIGTNPDLFFPTTGQDSSTAKEICNRCPVRDECLDYALTHRIGGGIWGGTSEKERRRMIRARNNLAPRTTVRG